jgi:hypothetical protein
MKRALLMAVALIAAYPLFAVPTTVTVRAVSRDAKAIGTMVGGAHISIRNAATGALLAEGVQLGETGDTKKIMVEPHERFGTRFGTEGTASFVATIDIDTPTLIEVTAEGPLKYRHAMQKASKTLMVVPGQHIVGEGLLLEIHGFVIDFTEVSPERIRMRMFMT